MKILLLLSALSALLFVTGCAPLSKPVSSTGNWPANASPLLTTKAVTSAYAP